MVSLKSFQILGLFLAFHTASSTISSNLLQKLSPDTTVDVFITVNSPVQNVLSLIDENQPYASRGDKATHIVNTLKQHAAATQAPILRQISNTAALSSQVKTFWITNKILVKGANRDVIQQLATRPDVREIREVETFNLVHPVHVGQPSKKTDLAELEWGLKKIEIEGVWAAGINGSGVRIGGLDTGARHTHESIRDNFAKDYNWFDAVEGVLNPIDPHGHGTHITGTIVGKNGIGVAPGAEWVHCRGMDRYGSGTEDMFIGCAEWFACPTKPDGSEPDCSKAPILVSNSWGFFGGGKDFLDDAISVWLKAGIVPVFANGNEGPSCGHLRSPGDSPIALVAVGATNINDQLAYFTSFGPSYQGLIKPDIAAPGQDVKSASGRSDTDYVSMSGTSMAAPHVAGVVALLASTKPDITIGEITSRLYRGATHRINHTGRNCGGIPESVYPNNHVGWGLLSASTTLLKT